MTCRCERDRGINAPPKPCTRAAARVLEWSLPTPCGPDRRESFDDTSESKLCGTCIPMLNGINFQSSSTEASFSGNFERFTVGRLSLYPGTVKLLRSPGKAGGFPIGLNSGKISRYFARNAIERFLPCSILICHEKASSDTRDLKLCEMKAEKVIWLLPGIGYNLTGNEKAFR